jgi:hypothetical protein
MFLACPTLSVKTLTLIIISDGAITQGSPPASMSGSATGPAMRPFTYTSAQILPKKIEKRVRVMMGYSFGSASYLINNPRKHGGHPRSLDGQLLLL